MVEKVEFCFILSVLAALRLPDEADAQSNFDEVSEAFEVLSDCESRLPPR